jgi:ribosomal protein S18 acetylase RimI-like enzyme
MKWTIELLTGDHDHSSFACGQDWLDRYLKFNAMRNQANGYGRTYVAVGPDSKIVVGYYTVSMSSVQFANLPESLIYSTAPKYPMPTAHLGCLAVRKEVQRRGLGSILLINAMQRMILASEVVAARAIEVKAADEKIRDWYADYGFAPFKNISGPTFHMFLPIDTARMVVAEGNAADDNKPRLN